MKGIHRQLEIRFESLASWVCRKKYLTAACMILVTLILALQMPHLTIDTRDESFFHNDDPALVAYNDFRDIFGQDDTFIIAMKPRNGMTRDFFHTLRRFHRDLEEAVPYLDDITSLVNGRIVRAEGDTLFVEDLMEKMPETDAETDRVMALIDRYPLYENLLISPDRTVTAVLVKAKAVIGLTEEEILDGFEGEDEKKADGGPVYLSNAQNVEIAESIHKVTATYRDAGIDFYFAGTPAFVAEIQKGIEEDLATMIPLSFLMIIIFLALLFRRISGVAYPLIIVFFSLLSTFGIMAVARLPITNAVQILPTFLIVVGIADSVHILTIFYRVHRETGDKNRAIVRAVGHAGLPVLMTSVTTAFGLFSFIWADVAIIAQLGYIAPVGVMLAFIYTVTLLPAFIAIFPVKQGKAVSGAGGGLSIADRLFSGIARVTVRRPLLVAAVWAVIAAAAVYSALSVRFSHNAMTWFPEDAPIRVSTELIDKVNGGTVMLEALIDSGRENGLHDPGLMRRLDEAAAFIAKQQVHGIRAGKTWSVADMVKETNRALNKDRDDAYTIPDTKEMIAQEMLLFESGGSDDLEDVADSTWQTARLSILAPFTDSFLYKEYLDAVRSYLDRQFPGETVHLTGHMVLFARITEHFITSMAKSYLFAFAVITVLMVLMIGRAGIGVMSMAANAVPVICVFGIMGLCGIHMDMFTILVGSIVLGLVVDDTIHFLHHFRRNYEKTSDVEASVRETLFSTGRALVITSLVLCGGFLIYMTSYLLCNIRFGLLVGAAVLFALAADFFLVPAFLSLIYGKKSAVRKEAVSVMMLAVVLLPIPAWAEPLSARAIMERADARDDGDRHVADMRMLLADRHGKTRTRTLRSFGIDRGDDRLSLMFFLSPGDVKGSGFLSYDYDAPGKDDDQWLYLPALKKVKRIAVGDKSGSFMGSDFSYADMTKRRLDDYTYAFYQKQPETEVRGEKVWVVECTPAGPEIIEETGYTRLILFIRQDIFMAARAVYFVKDGGYVKYCDVKRTERIDGVWTDMEIHMTRKKGKKTVHKTVLTFSNVKCNRPSVDEAMFTPRRLEKGL